MKDGDRIIDDDRPILSAWAINEEGGGATVGYKGITLIEPYEEYGEMAAVTWLRVWRGDFLKARLNTAHMAEICYAREETPNADHAEPV
jgi:hypothetical protein